jgi:hypothetical protein
MLPRLLTGLGLLSAASIGTVLLIPVISGGRAAAGQPSFALIASIGVVLIVLTSLFLAYANRVMGLGLAWFLWALIYNGCIVVTKFIVSPTSLYQTTFVGSAPFNARNVDNMAALALGLFGIYACVFLLIHFAQRGRVKGALRVLAGPESGAGQPVPRDRTATWVILVCVALVILIVLTAGSMLLLGLTYLFTILGTAAIALLLLLGGALTGGIVAFQRAGDRSIQMRDIAILTSFAWVGISLLLLYHVLWVIFTAILISIWPLRVVPSSGK